MRRVIFILVLILAGELIFGLPFGIPRFFRPTYLDAFGFTNTELGDIFAVYGVAAMLSYFPGGVLTDRFPARNLMVVSLFATAAGGLYMATYPSLMQMAVLYGFWGITTILLFWAALISATRDWGGDKSQGKAFGILDGGRGLAAALFAVFAVMVFGWFVPENIDAMTNIERREAFRIVILLYSGATAVCGLLVWRFLPKLEPDPLTKRHNPLAGMIEALSRPIAWALAAIIVCAYCGYKGLDNYSLYAVEVLGMNEVDAANFTAYSTFLRPLGAVTAGILADRFSASKTIGFTFLTMVLAYGMLSAAVPGTTGVNFIFVNMLVSYFAVFALRGVYFALLEETHTPAHLTGTTVGMVSFIGYTPDVFFAPIAGRILDASPGLAGHQNYFMFLAVTAALGVITVTSLIWLNRLR
jgi:nitrate/nitrite transporter NarK